MNISFDRTRAARVNKTAAQERDKLVMQIEVWE
jgi:hypothetical protein